MLSKSINHLEGRISIGTGSDYPSEVIRKSHECRKIPIQYLTVE